MGAAANISSEQEANLTADQKKRLQEYRESNAQAPAVQALAPVGAGGRGVIKGGTPGIADTGKRTAEWSQETKSFGRATGKNEGPGLVEANVADPGAEAQQKLEQQRKRFNSEDERNASRERQSELSRGARASRRRGSILTSPLGTIGDLASAISKTLLGQ